MSIDVSGFGGIKRVQAEDVYGKITFNDGAILYLGHPRPALNDTLIKSDGTKFRISDQIVDTDGSNDIRQGWAVTWEEWKSWGGNFSVIGEENGKPLITIDGNGKKVIESAQDVSKFLNQIQNAFMSGKADGMTEKELDELGEYAPL